ncbi:hypothetical protein BH10PSE12_BH10PSE12_25550 [soil metagenome]
MLVDHFGLLTVKDVIIANLPAIGLALGEVVRIKSAVANVKFQSPIDLGLYKDAVTRLQ